MLIDIYLFALVLGGVLLVASLVMGGNSTDVAADADASAEAEHGALGGMFGAFLSLRFWTFFAAFFGLTGFVFDGLDLLPGPTGPLVLAIIMGLATGLFTVWVLRKLQQSSSGAVPTVEAYTGRTGRVLLAFGPGELGKLRLELGGTTVDVLASTEDTTPFVTGDEAMVVEMRQNTALVTRIPVSKENPS